MRPFGWRLPLLAALFGSILLGAPARGDDQDLTGTKKLVVAVPFRELEILVADLKPQNGRIAAEIKETIPIRPTPELSVITNKGGVVRFFLKQGDVDSPFVGGSVKDGTIYGTLTLQGQEWPARLEKTSSTKLAMQQNMPPALFQSYNRARAEKDVKSRVKALRDLLAERPGDPTLALVYPDVLNDAEAAGLSEADVKKIVSEWVEGSARYGDNYTADIHVKALAPLAGKAPFAKVALDLAKAADAAVKAEVPVETRAELAKALAKAAKAGSDADLAKSASAKADKLEAEVDAEYHKKVPPFTPAAESGVNLRKSDRVVLLELFTGAECPPCIAVDIAFDGVITTYKPAELVTLQYHLHIPRPDPMTNPDSVARADYYPELQGTPTLFLDGRVTEGLGGNSISESKSRYEMLRRLVDQELVKASGAKVDLKVVREGEAFKISSAAEATAEQIAKDSARIGGSKLRLRLAVIEDQIRYKGGNNLRFHHHVVRALLGGAGGVVMNGGKGTFETTLKIDELRKTQEQYLSDFQKKESATFTAAPPLDLNKLSVVAFVQDDSDKSVLNAAIAPIDEPKGNHTH